MNYMGQISNEKQPKKRKKIKEKSWSPLIKIDSLAKLKELRLIELRLKKVKVDKTRTKDVRIKNNVCRVQGKFQSTGNKYSRKKKFVSFWVEIWEEFKSKHGYGSMPSRKEIQYVKIMFRDGTMIKGDGPTIWRTK